jgi:hypothetical protein
MTGIIITMIGIPTFASLPVGVQSVTEYTTIQILHAMQAMIIAATWEYLQHT